jgi:hypothetical protein
MEDTDKFGVNLHVMSFREYEGFSLLLETYVLLA